MKGFLPYAPLKGNRLCRRFLLLAGLIIMMSYFTEKTYSQADTIKSVKIETQHSIKRAAIFSAALPGLGQAYNSKYWKIPIIYAGFGVIGYFIYTNNDQYQVYKEAYIYVANGETYEIDNPYVGKYTQSQLQQGMDYYRRNRDLSIIIAGLWYTLNILEAYVDAHFFTYDISEDLSMHLGPAVTPTAGIRQDFTPGIKISLKF